jgi:hypothetical protein
MSEPGAVTAAEKNDEHLGPYRLLRQLGEGGMGVVYEAHDPLRGRRPALKRLHRVSPKALYRFKNEFRRAADLSHPNLIRLYELSADGDDWFFTMELIEGVDFRAHIEQARSSPAESGAGASIEAATRDVLRQLAQGIAALHAAGLLHLDLKPANVLVERGGRVVVLDFGVSHPSAPSAGPADGARGLAGTALYFSPEQVAGHEPTRASDWYAVGLMLFEALTGELPFSGSVWESLYARANQPAPLASSRRPGVPADLDELCARLLERDPAARPSGAEVLERLGAAPTPEAAVIPLIGRGPELEALLSMYTQSGARAPGYVHVRGPSGIGKSALARHFIQVIGAIDQPLIFTGRCYEWESVPYKGFDPIVDALAKHLEKLPLSAQAALVDEDAALTASIFPVLRTCRALRDMPLPPGDERDPLELRHRAFVGLRRIFERLCAKRRVVLFLDDLQWGDSDGAALLIELFPKVDPPPLFVIATYRSDEAEKSPFFRELRALQSVQVPVPEPQVVDLEALGPEQAVELATALYGDPLLPDEAQRIARESAGNPFFIEELSRRDAGAPAGEGAMSLERVIQARVGRLPEGARKLLRAVAVAARPLAQDTVIAAAHLTSEDPLGALAHLRTARLVRTRGPKGADPVEPYHDRIRESAVAELSPGELRAIHASLAQELLADESTEPELLVHHLHGAGEDARAAVFAARAAEQADAALAFDRAAELYGQAIAWGSAEPGPRRALHEKRGRALVNAGRSLEAAHHFLEAGRGASLHERRDLERRAIEAYLAGGHVDRGLEVAKPVLKGLGLRYHASPVRAALSAADKLVRLELRDLPFGSRAARRSTPEDLARVDLCWTLGKGLSYVLPTHGLSFAFRTLLLALETGDPVRIGRSLAQVGGTMSFLGGFFSKRAEAHFARARELARESGDPYLEGVILIWGAFGHMYTGRWRALEEESDRGLRILRDRCSGVHWECVVGECAVNVALNARGELGELGRRVAEYQLEAAERGDVYGQVTFALDVAYCRFAQGDTDGARAMARWVLERWTQEGYTVQHFYAMRLEAYCDLYEGRAAEAWARLEREWSRVERAQLLRVPMSRIDVLLLKARILLSLAETRGPKAIQACEAIARLLAREPVRVDGAAHASLIRASIASLRGDRGGAVDLLRRSADRYDELDMGLFAACARRRIGDLTGDTEIAREAGEWMRRRGVPDASRFTKLFVPIASRLAG